MSEGAIIGWGKVYGVTNVDLRVWMGETILYHEKIADLLEN
jgi:hypothetical protein